MFKPNQEPDIPEALGLLSHLNNDELKELLNNDGKFEDIVKDIKQVTSFITPFIIVDTTPIFLILNGQLSSHQFTSKCPFRKQFKDLETEKEMLMASNRSLAEFNLSKQPELQSDKQMLKELSETGNTLCLSVKEKLDELSKFV